METKSEFIIHPKNCCPKKLDDNASYLSNEKYLSIIK